MRYFNYGLYFFASSLALNTYAADETNDADKIEYKLTSSYYSSDNSDAFDINLRGNTGNHTGWIGDYQDNAGFKQARAGYEYKQDENILRITWSAQIASRGFLGGSATAEVGGDTFAIVGIGRTNLRDYYNLNFDPNDALTAGIGSRAIENTELSLFCVWDNRLDTEQEVTHAVVRYKPADKQRITLDASYKTGLSNEGNYVRGAGLSLTYDYLQYFIRIAEDQKSNFTPENMFRFSAGIRF